MQSFKLKFLGVTILQGVVFPIFLLIFEWALQQCSATALPVIIRKNSSTAAVLLQRSAYRLQSELHDSDAEFAEQS